MTTQFFQSMYSHFLVSTLPGALGALVGIFVGRLLTPGSRNADRATTSSWKGWYWIPWRGVTVTLVVVSLISPYPPIWFGLGRLAGSATIFAASLILALGLSVQAGMRRPGELNAAERGVRTFRTVTTASVALGITAGLYGAGGAGGIIWEGVRTLDYQMMWSGYAVVAALALLTDLAAGALGWLYLRRIPGTQE
jgi:osmoprotectant transport system permease protein